MNTRPLRPLDTQYHYQAVRPKALTTKPLGVGMKAYLDFNRMGQHNAVVHLCEACRQSRPLTDDLIELDESLPANVSAVCADCGVNETGRERKVKKA
jgi:hypothetical protein